MSENTPSTNFAQLASQYLLGRKGVSYDHSEGWKQLTTQQREHAVALAKTWLQAEDRVMGQGENSEAQSEAMYAHVLHSFGVEVDPKKSPSHTPYCHAFRSLTETYRALKSDAVGVTTNAWARVQSDLGNSPVARMIEMQSAMLQCAAAELDAAQGHTPTR